MFGQGSLVAQPPFGGAFVEAGGGVAVVGVGDVVAAVEVVDPVVVVALLVESGAAGAPAMPAAAPPAASAPATIVAPSSLDVFIRSNLLGWVALCDRSIVHHTAKEIPRPA
jgi:hypothetical protein